MIIKQSVVDVLMFLFESYLDDDNNHASQVTDGRDNIQDRLEELGFHNKDINQAFDWLEDLAVLQADDRNFVNISEISTRIYSREEKQLIDQESIGFLGFLEENSILTSATREFVLDRIVALGQPLDVEQLKWIIMIVLHTNPARENASTLIENFIFDDVIDHIH
jgi:Smg protein